MENIEQMAREERNRYSREWARSHPESRRKTQREYWLRKAQRRLAEEQAQAREEDDLSGRKNGAECF